MGYLLIEDVKEDLKDIYNFTEDIFGENQAQKYVIELYKIFELLGENPNIGANREDLIPTMRSFPYESHTVFFMPQEDEDNVAVLRVLHGMQDFQKTFIDLSPAVALAQAGF